MSSAVKRKIPVSKSNWFGIFEMITPASDPDTVVVRKVRGLMLVERAHFIKYVQEQSITDRLLRGGHLTPYHANGQKKAPGKNGRMPSTKVYYDLIEWRDIDFNNL